MFLYDDLSRYDELSRDIAVRKRLWELLDLLKEWHNTPFFEDRSDWERWVSEFEPRVRKAISDTEFHWCRACGGCRISLACCYHSCDC